MLIALQVLLATTVASAVNLGAILAITRSGWTRAFSTAVSATFLVLPFVVPAPPLVRVLLAHVVALQWMRVVEVARAPDRFARAERVARVLFPGDTRSMTRSPRSLAVREHLLAISELVVGIAGGVFAASAAPETAPYVGGLASWGRWLGVLGCSYVAFDGAMRLLVASVRPFGWTHAPIQRAPILSRTLAELWGQRWNRVIGRWLRENVFEPCARRGRPRFGIVAAFVASAAFHVYVIAPAAGIVPAAWVGAFFALHGVALLIEAKLGVRRWRPLAARAFTLSVFVLTAPLIAEGFLRALAL